MPADEFETIAKLLRPLTRGAPEALELLDDAAVLKGRPGFDLVITKDAIVEGVHFLPDDPLDLVARKLLRVNLSDLAAKAAEPFGYFLAIGWTERCDWPARELFARGLAEDGQAFNLSLLGGDTTSTPGPLTASVTMLGWVPEGGMVKRSGARSGDLLVVSGTIGDGYLGLKGVPELVDRYRLPQPRLELRPALQAHARAAADVSDGLLADAGHIAEASGCAVRIELEKTPLSEPARRWIASQPDPEAALLALATGGDDYEIVCAIAPEDLDDFRAAAGLPVTVVGAFEEGQGVIVTHEGATLTPGQLGYRHC
ncbi:MAG: thiamine-phosphate kinase [Ignavibacteriales bacterium]